jgi:hypothetical protein
MRCNRNAHMYQNVGSCLNGALSCSNAIQLDIYTKAASGIKMRSESNDLVNEQVKRGKGKE